MSMLLCRFCLFKDNLQSIHDFMKVCPKFLKVMNLIFNIKIKGHDGLPQVICQGCVDIIEAVSELSYKAQKSQKYLNGLKKKIKIKPVPPENDDLDIKLEEPLIEITETIIEQPYTTTALSPQPPEKIVENQGILDNTNTEISKKISRKSTKPTICDICFKKFPAPYKLKLHVDAVHSKDKFTCDQCQKEFKNQLSLSWHKRSHMTKEELDKLKQFQCPQCDKSYGTKGTLKAHIDFYHAPPQSLVCEYCAKTFTNVTHMRTHISAHHTSQYKTFTCHFCELEVIGRNNFRAHTQSCDKKVNLWECDVCQRKCPSQSALRNHKRTHTDPIHKCDHCDKSFRIKKYLIEHMNTHTDGYAYSCKFCDKGYNARGNLYTHYKTRHSDVYDSSRFRKKLD